MLAPLKPDADRNGRGTNQHLSLKGGFGSQAASTNKFSTISEPCGSSSPAALMMDAICSLEVKVRLVDQLEDLPNL